jgi:chlorophyllide a oxygenase
MQVHLSETRVSSALDKLAQMETLVNDRLLPDGGTTSTAESTSLAPSTSSSMGGRVRAKKGALDVSGPVKSYNPSLKNFWYPVAFSSDLKEDTMVNR